MTPDQAPHTDDSIEAIELTTTIPHAALSTAAAAFSVASRSSHEPAKAGPTEAGCDRKHATSMKVNETQAENGGNNEAETKQRSTWRLVTIMIALFVSAGPVHCLAVGMQGR
jgi:hypothetical protein